MNDRDKMIERIRKLLALSESPNENEAMMAAHKANALLAEYNLTHADIEANEQSFLMDSDIETDSRPWRLTLASNVARLYFCDYFFSFVYRDADRKCGYRRMDAHTFVGEPHNVFVAKSMFTYLCDTIDRQAKDASKSEHVNRRHSYINAFRHGAALRLAARLAARYAELTDPPPMIDNNAANLPALYNSIEKKLQDFAAREYADVTQEVAFTGQINYVRASSEGMHAADKIGLDVQVEGLRSGHALENKTE